MVIEQPPTPENKPGQEDKNKIKNPILKLNQDGTVTGYPDTEAARQAAKENRESD